MSLKVFHLIFIILAALLATGCAAWSYYHDTAHGFGVASAVIAVALVIYGVWFIRKSKKIIT